MKVMSIIVNEETNKHIEELVDSLSESAKMRLIHDVWKYSLTVEDTNAVFMNEDTRIKLLHMLAAVPRIDTVIATALLEAPPGQIDKCFEYCAEYILYMLKNPVHFVYS